MKTALSIPILGVALMFQVAVLSRVQLLAGCADLILVILAAWSFQERVSSAWQWAIVAGVLVGFVSGLPWFVPLVGYLFVVFLAGLLRRRVWQAPLLAMFTITFVGTMMMNIFAYLVLRLSGEQLPLGDSFSLVILPAMLLNLLIALPVYPLMRDLARRLYPSEVEE